MLKQIAKVLGGAVEVVESPPAVKPYNCPRCPKRMDTVEEQDRHMALAHGLHWTD